MNNLVLQWDSLTTELRLTHQHIAPLNYTIGYTFGSAKAFEDAAHTARSARPEELGEISLQWDILSEEFQQAVYQQGESEHHQQDYEVGFNRGKSDAYQKAAGALRSILKEYIYKPQVTSTPDTCFYAYDWVINYREIMNVISLIHIALALNCELRQAWDTFYTPEGYKCNRYAMCAPSLSVFQKFLKYVNRLTPFKDWFPIAQEYFTKVSYIRERRLPDLQERYNPLGDGVGVETIWNDKLREKLQTHVPLHFAYDWIIPPESPDGWLNSLLNALCDVGCFVRPGEVKQTAEAFFVQVLIIRLFDQEDLSEIANATNTNPDKWYSVTQDVFLPSGHPISERTLTLYDDFYTRLDQMSQANRILQRRG